MTRSAAAANSAVPKASKRKIIINGDRHNKLGNVVKGGDGFGGMRKMIKKKSLVDERENKVVVEEREGDMKKKKQERGLSSSSSGDSGDHHEFSSTSTGGDGGENKWGMEVNLMGGNYNWDDDELWPSSSYWSSSGVVDEQMFWAGSAWNIPAWNYNIVQIEEDDQLIINEHDDVVWDWEDDLWNIKDIKEIPIPIINNKTNF